MDPMRAGFPPILVPGIGYDALAGTIPDVSVAVRNTLVGTDHLQNIYKLSPALALRSVRPAGLGGDQEFDENITIDRVAFLPGPEGAFGRDMQPYGQCEFSILGPAQVGPAQVGVLPLDDPA
jgi:hypothetical protein